MVKVSADAFSKLLEWTILTQLDSVKQPAPSNVGGRPYEGRQVFYDWDHPFYWVSQLFEENWQPHATYRAESVDPLAR